jgi:hypothetical protein
MHGPRNSKRDALIKVWLTPSEKQHVLDVASVLKVSTSAYGRHRLLTGIIFDKDRPDDDLEMRLHEDLGTKLDEVRRDLKGKALAKEVGKLLNGEEDGE